MSVVYQDDLVTLHQADSFQLIGSLDVTVDLVSTDPSYGETHLGWDRRAKWLDVVEPRLAGTGSVWFWTSMRVLWNMLERGHLRRWVLVQDALWAKHNGSGFCADRLRKVHEHLVHVRRRDQPWSLTYNAPVHVQSERPAERFVRRASPSHLSSGHRPHAGGVGGVRLQRSVFYARSMHRMGADHPFQKPLRGSVISILSSCPPGGLVLDPFCGSATTLVAAAMLGRRAIGIEREPRYAAAAARRLERAARWRASTCS